MPVIPWVARLLQAVVGKKVIIGASADLARYRPHLKSDELILMDFIPRTSQGPQHNWTNNFAAMRTAMNHGNGIFVDISINSTTLYGYFLRAERNVLDNIGKWPHTDDLATGYRFYTRPQSPGLLGGKR